MMTANFIFVQQDTPGTDIAKKLALSNNERTVIFLIAGAKLTSPVHQENAKRFVNSIAKTAIRHNAIVIDGGTAYGPMGLLNNALEQKGFSGSYIGFTPSFSARREEEVDTKELGSYHSHFVLVEGDNYGDERKAIFSLIKTLRSKAPAVGVVINGGKLAKEEVLSAVEISLPLITAVGSGRLADELANPSPAGEVLTTEEAEKLRQRGSFVFIKDEGLAASLDKITGSYQK